MKEEIQAAVEWWVQVVSGEVRHENGDAFQGALGDLAASKVKVPTTEQVVMFRLRLTELLTSYLNDPFRLRGWQEAVESGNPAWGQYERLVKTDYQPWGELADAANLAGISHLRFPWKTVMWINPGEVKVACGYRSAPVRIYPVEVRDDRADPAV